ncbi:hypothetical protein ScPMuIL_007962 [Solemya velum]
MSTTDLYYLYPVVNSNVHEAYTQLQIAKSPQFDQHKLIPDMMFDESWVWPGWSLLKTAVTVGLAVLVYKLIVFTLRIRSLYKAMESCPQLGRKHFSWIHGNLHEMPVDGEGKLRYFENLRNCENGGKKMALYWSGPFTPRIVLHHPDTMKELYHTADPKPLHTTSLYKTFLPWLGEGLISSSGARWARTRRLLTPAFHFDILRSYMTVKNDACNQFLSNVAPYAKSRESFELVHKVSLCTMDIILRCAFSYESNCQNTKEPVPYIKAVEEIVHIALIRNGTLWMHPDLVFALSSTGRDFKRHCDFVHTFAQRLIDRRKITLNEHGLAKKRCTDFLDTLLMARDEKGNGMTDEEIQNEVHTFLFAGFDTTTSAISWIIYTLAQHQDYQERVFLEVEELMTGRENEEVFAADFNRIPLLTMCIKEGLRLHSPVPFITRYLDKDRVIDNVLIPAGVSVMLSIFGLHSHPDLWENPSEFIPERFSKENIADRDPFHFTPFAAGPRNCIGQNFALHEIKLFLVKLFYRYRVRLDSTHAVKKSPEVVMKAQHGIRVTIEPRSMSK